LSYARINLLKCGKIKHPTLGMLNSFSNKLYVVECYYSMISVTCPAPTVRPPSRIAKRRPFSIAIVFIRCTSKETLSPGITISTPSGRWQSPVTSVVRK